MKKLILPMAIVCLLANSLQAGVILGTSNPADTPLMMNPGMTSGLMLVNVVSDNFPKDVMAAWNFRLEINPESGATGMLTFQDPATGTPANPSNYIFGGDGFGISATNTGSVLSANDFYTGSEAGVPVPGGSGANLLQMDFFASSDASGLFGIYAVEGLANTVWTDDNITTQFFTNAPDETGTVLIGEVKLPGGVQPIPEPSTLTLFWLGSTALVSWNSWRQRKPAAA